jgi:lysyl-tRNA synthetase class I
VIAGLPDDELAARLGVPLAVVPALGGAHDLNEARALAATILERPKISLPDERATLERFRELREGANGGLDKDGAKAIVRELKAVGGNLRAVRRALTGRDSGPELWSVIAALPREETVARIDAAL